MSTLADELLNDFEDSGSEAGEEQENGFLQEEASPPAVNGQAHAPEGFMILDGDEEDVDEDDEMSGSLATGAAVDIEDEEATKAKVEKMQLGRINDVRNVAGLTKTLEPVLQVCVILLFSFDHFLKVVIYILCEHSPDLLSSPPENCPLPKSTSRAANELCRFDRR